jgi:hypothetical protein
VTPTPAPDVSVTPEPAVEPMAATPILINEQQVAFNMAAALRLSPNRTHWRVPDGPYPSRGTTADVLRHSRPARRDCPRRYSYLEAALMGREMDRL